MINTILDKIKQYQTIIIHRHTRPDGDCMGSQIGLKEIIQSSFPKKDVYMVGEEKEQFYMLGRMDQIADDLYKDALVIVVDVSNEERFSDSRYQLGKELIKIDHHPRRKKVCDIEWVDTSYASCCEMIVDFYRQFKNELTLSQKGANALYYGMVTDTNRFATPSISKRTFTLAAFLMDFDIHTNEIYENIYTEKELMMKLRCYVVNHFIRTPHGVGYILLDQNQCLKYEVNANISNVLVNSLSYIEGIEVWFVAIFDEETGRVRISLRSKEKSINQFAEKYGGGGHKNASGIMVDTFEQAEQLAKDLDDYLSL